MLAGGLRLGSRAAFASARGRPSPRLAGGLRLGSRAAFASARGRPSPRLAGGLRLGPLAAAIGGGRALGGRGELGLEGLRHLGDLLGGGGGARGLGLGSVVVSGRAVGEAGAAVGVGPCGASGGGGGGAVGCWLSGASGGGGRRGPLALRRASGGGVA